MGRMNRVASTLRPDWVSDEMYPFESRFFATASGHRMHFVDEGRIPCCKVGAHRRVRTRDILDYRGQTESRRREALDELTAVDQDLGLQ